MIVLSIVFLLLVGASFFNILKGADVYCLILLIFFGILLVALATFRIGDRDFSNYVDVFKDVPDLIEGGGARDIHGEPGYLFLNSLFKTIGLSYRWVFFATSFASVFLALHFFRTNTRYFLIALIVYFSHTFLLRDMMQIRSGVAASISLYSFKYLYKRSFLPFLTLIVGAATLHAGVLVFILGYFIYPLFRENYKRMTWLVFSGFALGLIFNQSLISFVFTNILHIPAVAIYILDPQYFASLGLFNPVLIKNLLLFYFVMKNRDILSQQVPYFDAMTVFLVFGIFWLSAFNNFSILAGRIATYFTNGELILVPSLFYTKYNKILLWGIVVLYCIVMFVSKFSIFENLTFAFI